MTNLGYNSDSVDRALNIHATAGLITGWRYGPGTSRLADLTNGDTVNMRTLRDAYLFVVGLASAAQAASRRYGQVAKFVTAVASSAMPLDDFTEALPALCDLITDARAVCDASGLVYDKEEAAR